MASFDEEPDAPAHGECAAEIARLRLALSARDKALGLAKPQLEVLVQIYERSVGLGASRGDVAAARAALDAIEAELKESP